MSKIDFLKYPLNGNFINRDILLMNILENFLIPLKINNLNKS